MKRDGGTFMRFQGGRRMGRRERCICPECGKNVGHQAGTPWLLQERKQRRQEL